MWDCLDLYGVQRLDIITLRELIKRCYSYPINALEKAISRMHEEESWGFEQFWALFGEVLSRHLPVVQDRMHYHRFLLQELECSFDFTIESLERLWNMYAQVLNKPLTT